MHRVGPAGGQRRRGGVVVPRQLAQPPGEVHGLGLHGHGRQAHHPLEGTGMLGDEPHFLCAKAFQAMGVQVVAGRRADKGRGVGQAVLNEARRGLPEQGSRHPQEVEGVVVAKEVGERRLWDGVVERRGEGDARREGRAGGAGLQVDADPVGVLDMLEEEPGTGERLLTRGADIAGGLVSASWKIKAEERTLDLLIPSCMQSLYIYTNVGMYVVW